MKVALDLHDFNIVSPRMEPLLRLKEYFPNFKVSLFTIPEPRPSDYGPYLTRHETLREIKKHLDWMQIIPHGVNHESSREMKHCSYEEFLNTVIPTITRAFERDGLPFEKGFCAPHWRRSEGVIQALNQAGWWEAVMREEKALPEKFYRYNYLLNEPFWESAEPVLKLHGHTFGTKNDVGLCFDNLLKLPRDTEWHYVTDFLEETL